jgi:nucleolar protein 15
MSKLIQKKAAEQASNIKEKEQAAAVLASVNSASKKRKASEPAADEKKSKAPVGNNNKKQQKGLPAVEKSSVMYLGHIPDGFFEVQLKKFFMQFGIVRKLKLFRSPKTGGSRGFAFLQFESGETAETVVGAMDGYYLHNKRLVARIIPVSAHHSGMWKMKKPSSEMEQEVAKSEETKVVDPKAAAEKAHKNLMKKIASKQLRLNDLGIDFEIPALQV